MITRRNLLLSSIATLAAPPVLGHSAEPYVVPEAHMPVIVELRDVFPAGDILVDPNSFRLYWTLPDRYAIRYVVGIGRAGLYESGTFTVGAKKEWPSWTPTKEMIERDPEAYERYADGMPGGPDNPLGARALYLFTPNGGDSFLRIHGTPEPWTIGSAVSNGCTRLVNEHILDLYERVPLGTRVTLYPKSA